MRLRASSLWAVVGGEKKVERALWAAFWDVLRFLGPTGELLWHVLAFPQPFRFRVP